ncbi:hypothetical protein [Cohnella thailandensis]|uniref:Uncharacterized protein n=1 Tax=Cohnella thailandensis TaxID=557557 RepID=A0A841T029_9BACL|nr:hypothetical protein [Cohnella thailandensis]MBB6636226.1 hypothetical protein [Cohnella thailandensis]MBP1973805.1 hypothetical protein [Cohnella thailandensis]
MERLIEFLLGNIYYVVVVVGLIYAMFFRKSPDDAKRPNRMPDFGGGGQRRERPQGPPQRPRRPGEAPAGTKPQGRPAARPEREEPRGGLPGRQDAPAPARTAEPAYEPAPRPAASPFEAPAYGEPAPAVPAALAAAHASQARADGPSPFAEERPAASSASPVYAPSAGGLQPSREDLARAIVWSEILGPPRARKPFRR